MTTDFTPLHDHGDVRAAEIRRDRLEAGSGGLIVVDRVHDEAVYCPPESVSFGVLKDGSLVQVAGPPPRASEWTLARVQARRRMVAGIVALLVATWGLLPPGAAG